MKETERMLNIWEKRGTFRRIYGPISENRVFEDNKKERCAPSNL